MATNSEQKNTHDVSVSDTELGVSFRILDVTIITWRIFLPTFVAYYRCRYSFHLNGFQKQHKSQEESIHDKHAIHTSLPSTSTQYPDLAKFKCAISKCIFSWLGYTNSLN